ncbi:MAG: alpha/beta hydrolase fold domain-containing protein [Gemmataceae bacterium]
MIPIVMSVLLLAPAAAPAPSLRWEKNVTFATQESMPMQCDIAWPSGEGPFPVVVVFHGGAWKYGRRTDTTSFVKTLAENGYVGVTASYRLAPKHKWPAQIIDAKTVVRFLRTNAKKYAIDPDRLGVMGFSAGGHLAAMLGTTTKADGLEGDLYPEVSSRPQCVVNFFGPTDLMLYTESPGVEQAYFKPFLGSTSAEMPELYKKASPIEYVSKDDPPFLLIHGNFDVIVPIIHSERLHEKLAAVGVKSELLVASGKGHGWGEPEAARTTTATLKFLQEYLKPGTSK